MPSSVQSEVMVEVVVKVSSCNQSWSSTTFPGAWCWLDGWWSDKTKLMLTSTQVEVGVEVW